MKREEGGTKIVMKKKNALLLRIIRYCMPTGFPSIVNLLLFILFIIIIIMKSTTTTTTTQSKIIRTIVVPLLSINSYKGENGKIGIIGGSFEYTGAPYLSAMAAMRIGCDITHIFTTKDASIPIKS